MATVTKHFCDVEGCREERVGGAPIQAFSHSTRDASGNGYEHWYAQADLCGKHLLVFANSLIHRIDEPNAYSDKKPIDLMKTLKIKYEER